MIRIATAFQLSFKKNQNNESTDYNDDNAKNKEKSLTIDADNRCMFEMILTLKYVLEIDFVILNWYYSSNDNTCIFLSRRFIKNER